MTAVLVGQFLTGTTRQPAADTAWWASLQEVYAFLSPYNEFFLVLFVLWLFAHRGRPSQGDFNRQAQDVLDAKYRDGEISRRVYDKYRQDISIRPKR